MWPDRVSNPGPLTLESGALPIGLWGPAFMRRCAIGNICFGGLKVKAKLKGQMIK